MTLSQKWFALWLRFLGWIWLLFFPSLLFAEETTAVTFAPPASDISVTFLGNIFGVVDGVLHGTGSQIMGVMFGVFNAAVLALGGIVIMYIILVATMNTAHEGQMLGQKWSSIWIPLRSTIGLALLIPKSSGYCMMQIFVMWVVLQGVGVADKIWGAALDYLNRGGVIIQANMAPNISMGADSGSIMGGAAKVLYGQVCMVGLQTQLEQLRDDYLAAKDKGTGPCAGTPSETMQRFCEESVPDFINTVDPITAYNNQHVTCDPAKESCKPETFYVTMPNFDSDAFYYPLNGICGTIKWNGMDPADTQNIDNNISGISQSDLETIQKSRAAAIEQVYITLSTTARTMVSNDPQINGNGPASGDASKVADAQFGVPYSSSQTVCTSTSSDCPNWGADPSTSAPVLLDGTELQDAVADYNAVMAPTLNLINDANNSSTANDERGFIDKAKERGWIMAGSYFFDLARLNGSAASPTTTDTNSGFNNSCYDTTTLTTSFTDSGCTGSYSPDTNCNGTYKLLCDIFTSANQSDVVAVESLIDGTNVLSSRLSPPNFSKADIKNQSGAAASLVYGYAANAALIDLPGQEGVKGPTITISADLDLSGLKLKLPEIDKGSCKGGYWSMLKLQCIPNNFMKLVYDHYVKPMVDQFMQYVITAVNVVYQGVVVYPLMGFTYIFTQGVGILGQEGVNPIIALAKMGTTYIDFAMQIWMYGLAIIIVGGWVPQVFALYMVISPLFLAWVGVMLAIGFMTAYFIPFLPYMIFTFGTLAWLIAVIEAMVAAPIVALGVAHPEGHDALGKSEAGLMILLNVFLRPGMMVVGYIAGIALSFVGIWIMNAGFEEILKYLESDQMWAEFHPVSPIPWARFFGFFFASLIYTLFYLVIVQEAFTLIAVLPDKVLRWIGGQPEGIGQETIRWGEEAKGKITEAGGKTAGAGDTMQKQLAGQLGLSMSNASPDSGGGDSASGPGAPKSSGGGSGGGGGAAGGKPPVPPP